MAKRSKKSKADIKIRLTEDLRSKIEKAAHDHGVSMNSEMIERLERSFEWERARTTVQQWMDDHTSAIRGDLEHALSKAGYTRIAMLPRGTTWASPDADLEKINLAIDAAAVVKEMQSGLVQVLAQALGKFAKKNDSGQSK